MTFGHLSTLALRSFRNLIAGLRASVNRLTVDVWFQLILQGQTNTDRIILIWSYDPFQNLILFKQVTIIAQTIMQ